VSDEDRDKAKKLFQDLKSGYNVIVGNRALIKGINLQLASHIFLYDIPWSYGWYRQLVGRSKRTGSPYPCIGVYHMLACLHPDVAALVGSEETIDHHTLKVVKKKKTLFNAITGDVTDIESDTSEAVEIFNEIKKNYKKVV
jgi:superfamily II DNA/RNA helicase